MYNVALIIDTLGSYGRGLLSGVARYVQTHIGWRVIYEERKGVDRLPRWLVPGSCDGVIARLRDGRQLKSLLRLGVPIVSLGEVDRRPAQVPETLSDHRAIGHLAARHLVERHLRHFAYFGSAKAVFSNLRLAGFREYFDSQGQQIDVFGEEKWDFGVPKYRRTGDLFWEDSRLNEWLRKLPKPVGIMACNDYFGRILLGHCQRLGLHVPNEIAVIGVDNDEILCELAVPPLTSVDPAPDSIGFRAAELLADLLAGNRAAGQSIYLPPKCVVARASTNIIAFDDPIIVLALQFIRDKVGVGIATEDILDYLAGAGHVTSRSTLERKFRRHLGGTPHDEIARARLEQIEKLLLGTRYPLIRIAQTVGVASEQQLTAFFRHHRHMTPGQFRQLGINRRTSG